MVTLAFLCELGVRGMLKHRAKKGLIDEDQHFFCDVSGWQIANPVLVYWCIWCILDAFWWQCLWIVCPEDTTTELRLEAVLPFVSEISRDTSEYPTLKKTQISPEHESGPKRHWSIVQGLMLLVLGKVNLAFLSLACLTRCPRCLQTLMQIYVHGSHVVVFSNMCCSNAFSLKTLPDISIQFWEKISNNFIFLKKKRLGVTFSSTDFFGEKMGWKRCRPLTVVARWHWSWCATGLGPSNWWSGGVTSDPRVERHGKNAAKKVVLQRKMLGHIGRRLVSILDITPTGWSFVEGGRKTGISKKKF